MINWVNGELIEATEAEIAEIEKNWSIIEAIERTRPMTMEEVSRMLIAQQINGLTVEDSTALRMKEFYPEWAAGVDYATGYKVQHGGRLWRCLQAHTGQTGWEPENVPALFTEITESHGGTLADPIPYDNNMELTEGLYYSQGGVTYRCTRSTGQPVYNALADLVGLYVEKVN